MRHGEQLVVGATYLMRSREWLVDGAVLEVIVVKVTDVGDALTARVQKRAPGGDYWVGEDVVWTKDIQMRIEDVE